MQRRLTFTSTSIAGKKMIVQATNTGADLASGQFDLAIPGGGVVRSIRLESQQRMSH